MNKSTKHQYGVKREVHQLDAAGKAVGRLATEAALLLMGKNKTNYSPQTDCGDCVEISNADKLKWSGKKLEQKEYIHHTNHPGGLRRKKVAEVFAANPKMVIKKTIYNMLPKNHLRKDILKRIKFSK